MKRILLVAIPVTLLLITAVSVIRQPSKPEDLIINNPPPTSTSLDSISAADFTAKFEIYTFGTKRIFTDKRYHNLSEDVFITTDNPSQIYIKRKGVTWEDFFKTLPMKLTSQCLTTGTKQTICTNDENELKFFINEVENLNALTKEIQSNDFLKVVYE